MPRTFRLTVEGQLHADTDAFQELAQDLADVAQEAGAVGVTVDVKHGNMQMPIDGGVVRASEPVAMPQPAPAGGEPSPPVTNVSPPPASSIEFASDAARDLAESEGVTASELGDPSGKTGHTKADVEAALAARESG